MIRKKDIKEMHEEAAASHIRGHISVGSPDAAISVAIWANFSCITQPGTMALTELSATELGLGIRGHSLVTQVERHEI